MHVSAHQLFVFQRHTFHCYNKNLIAEIYYNLAHPRFSTQPIVCFTGGEKAGSVARCVKERQFGKKGTAYS